jgi:hypothetical protein
LRRTSSGGAKLVLPPEEVRLKTAQQFAPKDPPSPHINLAWEASLRLIENDPVSYRS